MRKIKAKKRPKKYKKKLSLYPMTFEEVVDRALKIKPASGKLEEK